MILNASTLSPPVVYILSSGSENVHLYKHIYIYPQVFALAGWLVGLFDRDGV